MHTHTLFTYATYHTFHYSFHYNIHRPDIFSFSSASSYFLAPVHLTGSASNCIGLCLWPCSVTFSVFLSTYISLSTPCSLFPMTIFYLLHIHSFLTNASNSATNFTFFTDFWLPFGLIIILAPCAAAMHMELAYALQILLQFHYIHVLIA